MNSYECSSCKKNYKRKFYLDKHIEKCNTNIITNDDNISNINNNNNEIDINNSQFSNLSIKITKQLSIEEKKLNGIFFTPNNIIEHNLKFLLNYIKTNNLFIKNVLEPSCGSCEFIFNIDKYFINTHIDGIELNNNIFKNINNIKLKNNILTLSNTDFLLWNSQKKYDLIIGNPPYFNLNKKDINKKYLQFIEGRTNIYILFILKSIELLNDNGILSFILPCNFLNCLYYNKVRKYIYENFKILNIYEYSNVNDYIDTEQSTCVIIIQKINNIENVKLINERFVYDDKIVFFNTVDNIIKIKNLYLNSTTLNDMNFEVKVGNIVWNQVKDLLTDDENKTLLIYSSNISNNELSIKQYSNKDKKNYIDKKGYNDILLLVNRGYGKGDYKFNYVLIDTNKEYLIENHVIFIKYKNKIDNQTLKKLYNKIITSFNNNKTTEFIKLYFGNNAINTTELQYILPIYI